MADNWDDDDFEPEVKDLAMKVEEETPVDNVPKPQPSKPKPKSKIKGNDFEELEQQLGRKLTDKEKEEMQMKSDLAHAFDLLGTSEEAPSFSNLSTKIEFEQYGATIGKYFTSRSKSDHYHDFLNRLFVTSVEPLSSAELRKLMNALKIVEGEKKEAEEKEKKAGGGGKGGKAAKASGKPQLQARKGLGARDALDDYGDGHYDEEFDDFM